MPTAVEDLLSILDLEPLGADRFAGHSLQVGWKRVFGGQVVAQALIAATRTVADRPIHSLHGYFLRGGDPAQPIVYAVDRLRDGRSFATRRVLALQAGEAIFSMSASFHAGEPGLEHAMPPPAVPRPEDLPDEARMLAEHLADAPDNMRRYWQRRRPIELRPVEIRHYTGRDRLPPEQHVWLRAAGPLPDDPAVHAAVLAYASDITLLDTTLFAHGRSVFDRDLQLASLDHAMWFHRPFRADEWLLYDQDSPTAHEGRGLSRGLMFTESGDLAVSVVQEGLLRVVR